MLFKKVLELSTIYDNRKSFYGKAMVLEDTEGNTYLKSYDTIVLKLDKEGNLYDTWGDYSATTLRHQKEFIRQFTGQKVTKSFIDNLPKLDI